MSTTDTGGETALAVSLSSTLVRQLQLFASRARALAEELTDEEFWAKPYPYGNSVGHLVLHLTGNLNYYIGTRMAGTGYVRDRPLEFADTSHRPRKEVLDDLDRAVTVALTTIQTQSVTDWTREYEAAGSDEPIRLGMVLRCVEHFHHHQGQMIYLVKEHLRRRSAGAADEDSTDPRRQHSR